MSMEIEEYLIAKLDFEGTQNLQDLDGLFKELKEWLAGPNPPTTGLTLSPVEWQKFRREKLYQVNNLLTEWQSITKKWHIYTPKTYIAAHNLANKLKEVRKELKGGDGTGSTHQPRPPTKSQVEASSKKATESYRWSSRYVDPKKVHGLDAKVMSLERELVGAGREESGNSFKGIGIIGMPGIGKTTLAQLIFSRSKVKEYFHPRIWVCMSKQPNPEGDSDIRKEIAERILRSLGVEDETITMIYELRKLDGLIFALRLQLIEKRYLIVLDDVVEDWGNSNATPVQFGEVMKKLEYGLPKEFGGTIIVTSRYEKVATEMVGEDNLHKVVPLTDPNSCWLIFKDWVQKGDTPFPSTLEGFKDEIVKKCGGLPLSAKMMGQIVNRRLNQPRPTRVNPPESQPLPELPEQPEDENKDQEPTEETKNQEPTEETKNQEQIEMEAETHQRTEESLSQDQHTKEKMLQMESEEVPEMPQKELEDPQPESDNDEQAEESQPMEKQQPGSETQELTKQPEKLPLTSGNQQTMEEPQVEDQQPREEPEVENQELTEQQEKLQQTSENQQQMEEPQVEDHQLTEEPQVENQEMTEQLEKLELTSENQQPMEEQPQEENQELKEHPEKLEPMSEDHEPSKEPQVEKQELTEHLKQPELKSENQQPMEETQQENQELKEQQEKLEPMSEDHQPTKDPQVENQELTEQQEPQGLTSENQQSAEESQVENQQLTAHPEKQEPTELEKSWELVEPPQPENDKPTEEPSTEKQQELEKHTKE